MEKRWNLLEPDENKAFALQQSLKISDTLCKILVERGINEFDKAKAFFRPSLLQLHDPFLMKDMQKAVDRIKQQSVNLKKYWFLVIMMWMVLLPLTRCTNLFAKYTTRKM